MFYNEVMTGKNNATLDFLILTDFWDLLEVQLLILLLTVKT